MKKSIKVWVLGILSCAIGVSSCTREQVAADYNVIPLPQTINT